MKEKREKGNTMVRGGRGGCRAGSGRLESLSQNIFGVDMPAIENNVPHSMAYLRKTGRP